MKNKTLANSLPLNYPKFNCYNKVEIAPGKNNPEKDQPIFKLFSKKCKSGNQCFAVECPVISDNQN